MQTASPLVSVIITAYNDETYAARAIESVLQQTIRDFEIVLVDNNSTDGTLSIFRQYQEKYPEIIRVFEEKKQGCPCARNRGLREAKGEWIQILDSDDEILPAKLENQLPLTKNTEAELIVGGRWKYKMTAEGLQKKRKLPDAENMWKALLFFRFGSTNSCLWKRATLLRLNGWNESWTSVEDYEMYFRAMRSGVKPVFTMYADAIVHMRADSMSRSTDQKKLIAHIQNALKLRLMIRDHLKINGLLPKDLEKEFETDLYLKLLRWRSKAPSFIDSKIKELNLYLPIKKKVRQQWTQLRRSLTARFKKVFSFFA